MSIILVVDDEPRQRNTLTTLLADWGHTVVQNEGKLQLIPEKQIKTVDIALVDLRLNGSTQAGLDVVRKLRRLTPNVLIVAITRYGNNELTYDAMEAGADYFVRREEEKSVELVQKIINIGTVRMRTEKNARLLVPVAILGGLSVFITGALSLIGGKVALVFGLTFCVIFLVAAGSIRVKSFSIADIIKVETEKQK